LNDNLILVSGETATGKSYCLRNLDDPTGVMYLNCESNKKLPFKSSFQEFNIIDPWQVHEAMAHAETMPDVHTIVVDSLTYLMDQFESQYVLPATNTMTAWGEFAQFFKVMMQQHVANSTKNVIFLAHTLSTLNEQKMEMETKVPVKGALKNNGIESYFSTVISTKTMTNVSLEKYSSDLLTYTEDEKELGMKYVFQTRLTKQTLNEKIRSPGLMWSKDEIYIDNDLQNVIQKLHDFYK